MLAILAGLLLLAGDPGDFDPATGYRVTHYRAVVPAPPEGVARIGIDETMALAKRHGAILIDVTPAEGAVRDPATGRWKLAMPHESIPGAHWFPETGRGALAPGIEPWFVDGVKRLAARHPDRPVIVFCLADCWMSWNASRRLHIAGIADLRWFAEGADGWREAGLRLAKVYPASP